MSNTPKAASDEVQGKALHPQEQARLEQVANFPYVAVTIQSTGIHPSTGRLITIDALTYNDSGTIGQQFHAVLNPDTDPGPRHQHGLSDQEIESGQRFSRVLKPLDRLIDGRTLVLHDVTHTWGFLVSESRRAMTAAARANRSRNRGKGRRRRQKVGHVPAPVSIIDTLRAARLSSTFLADVRLAAVAAACGLAAPDYKASAARALRPEAETSRESTQLLISLERHLSATVGPLPLIDPKDMRADRFGLQRSNVRVDAAQAKRVYPNPGKFTGRLRKGMEFVVTPEVTVNPDELIAAGVQAGLHYVEKLSRETSVVVCNAENSQSLQGKAMHASRKDIPLIKDERFMSLLDNVLDPISEETVPTPATLMCIQPKLPRRSPGVSNDPKTRRRRRGSRSNSRRRRGKGNAD